ncbi:MAG: alpha/beta hydrolase [Bacteroidetes bacterium]|nr:alpha/beta hydrolase [Bacteroidota bacterium]
MILRALLTPALALSICLTASAQELKQQPIVLGNTVRLYSKQLGENRSLNIYLPDGYNDNDTAEYPVIYLLDGGVDEDFIHVVGLVQFNTFPWINRIPKSIVVGIVNTDRKRDMSFPTTIAKDKKQYPTTGGSAKFIAFLGEELQPYIRGHYRTNSSRTIIGESLGGLLATEILFKRPELFNRYIIISPSIWWDNGSVLKLNPSILNADYRKKTDIYIGVGKEGLTPTDEPRVQEVDANLLADKIKSAKNKKVRVYFDYLPQEDHATVSHQAIYNAFRLLYPVKH